MKLSVKLLFAPLQLRASEPLERREKERRRAPWNHHLQSLTLAEWHASVTKSASEGSV